MAEIVEQLNLAAAAWTDVVVAVLWQSTLLAVAVALVVRLLRAASPALRYWLWQIVAFKLLLMPFWTLPVTLPEWGREEEAVRAPAAVWAPPGRPEPALSLPGLSADGASEAAGAAPTAPPWWRRWIQSSRVDEITWQAWLVLVWVAGVAWQLGNIGRHRVRLARLLRTDIQSRDRKGAQDDPATDRTTDSQAIGARGTALDETIGELAGRIRLRRVPRLAVAEFEGSPFVCGIRRPLLVLPRTMLGALDPGQLRQVLLHELAHVKRRDLVWGWIPELARIFYWFHPVAHWVSYRVRLERELACDQLAMAHSGQTAAGYAQTLVRVVSQASAPPVLKAAAGTAGLTGHESTPVRESARNREEPVP